MKTKNLGAKRYREPIESSHFYNIKCIDMNSKIKPLKKKEDNSILENKTFEIIDLTKQKELEIKEIIISNNKENENNNSNTIIINENDTVPNSIEENSEEHKNNYDLVPYIEINQPEDELIVINNNMKYKRFNIQSDNIQIRIEIEENNNDSRNICITNSFHNSIVNNNKFANNYMNFNSYINDKEKDSNFMELNNNNNKDQIIEVSEEESEKEKVNEKEKDNKSENLNNNDIKEIFEIEIKNENTENLDLITENQNEKMNEKRIKNENLTDEEESSTVLNFDDNIKILDRYLKEKNGNVNYPHLSKDLVNKFFQSINGRDKVINDLILNSSSFKRLNKNKWLNDEIINAYGKMINIRNENSFNIPKVRIFSSFLLQKIFSLSIDEIRNDESKFKDLLQFFKKSRKQINLNDYQILLFPLNINNSHWALIKIELEKRELFYYDSLKNYNIDNFYPIFENITALIDKYLIEYEYLLYPNLNWTYNFMKNIPYQNNGSDCGVFVCQFMNYISKNKDFDFTQDDISYFRVLMGVELILGHLLSY